MQLGIYPGILPRHHRPRHTARRRSGEIRPNWSFERHRQRFRGSHPQARSRFDHLFFLEYFALTISGFWGLAGYPLDGLHKSLRNSLSRSKIKEILASRIQQGIDEMCATSAEERAMVVRRWKELQEMHGVRVNGSENVNGHAG